MPAWCHAPVPFAYSYVQAKYWGVGLFNYFQVKQIPNFLLATPMILIIMSSFIKFVSANRRLVATLGMSPQRKPKKSGHNPQGGLFQNENLLPYFVHGAFLCLFCFFYCHVQICTRLLCASSPLFYWIT